MLITLYSACLYILHIHYSRGDFLVSGFRSWVQVRTTPSQWRTEWISIELVSAATFRNQLLPSVRMQQLVN